MQQRKRPGWVLNREFHIATEAGTRPVNLRLIEDREAVREYLAHAAKHPVARTVRRR